MRLLYAWVACAILGAIVRTEAGPQSSGPDGSKLEARYLAACQNESPQLSSEQCQCRYNALKQSATQTRYLEIFIVLMEKDPAEIERLQKTLTQDDFWQILALGEAAEKLAKTLCAS